MRDIHEIEDDLKGFYFAYEPAGRYYFGQVLNELAEYKPGDKSLLNHLAEVLEDESILAKASMVSKARAWASLPDEPAVKAMRQSRGYAVSRLEPEDKGYALEYAREVIGGLKTWSMFDAEVLGKTPMEEREDICCCPECGKLHVRKAEKNG